VADYVKPLPTIDPETEPYWEATKNHELRAQRCSKCGTLRWPPKAFCKQCYSWDYSWDKVPETGTVTSYVVVHQSTVKVFSDDVPYIIAKITLDGTDGRVTITSNIVDYKWEDMKVGLKVKAFFDDVTDEVTLPKFRVTG